MKSTRKYFALVIVILFALLILYLGRDFILPILAAIIFSYLLFPIYRYLKEKSGREVLSASAIIVGILLLVLIPLSAFSGVLFSQVNNIDFSEEAVREYETTLEEKTGRSVPLVEILGTIEDRIKQDGRQYAATLLSITSNVLLWLFIMFFTMFYLLVQHRMFLRELINLLPFSKKNSKYLVDESGKMIRAVLIGQVLTAIIQGLLGMIAFFIAGVEGAFFWGIIMMVLSLIPLVGAFLIWLPAGALLILEGSVGMGIFVLVWGALVVSQVDNLIRPKLVNRFANIHPLETFLGIFIGLAAFGMIGVILGPLLLALFKVLLQVYRKEYVKE